MSEQAKSTAADGTQRIGKYEIVGLLGKGGMGAVYRAFDPVLEREVALKVMLPQIAEDPEQKQRFEREARAVARLTHPNVVTVFDLGYHTDGAPYIVMELLQGERPPPHPGPGADPAARAEGLHRPAGARRARPGPQGRHRPPRHQARQRVHHRATGRPRSWTSASRASARRAPPPGAAPGNRGLHVSRAGERRPGRRPQRPVQRRLAAVRAAHRPATVRGRDPGRHPVPDRPQGAGPPAAGRDRSTNASSRS